MQATRTDIVWPLAGFVVVWTLCGTIATLSRPLHQDMLEAWVWGQELQLGYFKHPPLSAWVAGLWFAIMPRDSWSFYLLAMINSAVGLTGIWMIARRLSLDPNVQQAAVWLHGLAPFYSLFALNFNPNSIQLAIWPWVMEALIRVMQTRRMHHAMWLGLLAGLAMLAKYYAIILLGCCFLSALVHPQAGAFFRSGAPYVAAVVAAMVVAPHLVWAAETGFTTLAYAVDKIQQPYPIVLRETLVAAGASLLMLGGIAALSWRDGRHLLVLLDRQWRWLAILAFGPFLLTIGIGLAGLAKISIVFMTPDYALVPLALLMSMPTALRPAGLRRIRAWAVAVQLAFLCLSPGIAFLLLNADLRNEAQRGVELAATAERIWEEELGTPMSVVGGFGRDAEIIAFYGKARPSVLIGLDFAQAPWVSRERIAAEGMLIVCGSNFREACRQRAEALGFAGMRSRRVVTSQRLFGWDGAQRAFDLHLVPPEGRSRRQR